MVIRNNDADTSVFCAGKEGDTDFAGFEIAPGKDIELFHNDPVWLRPGTAGGGTVSSVSVLSEFDVD
jgi:hypothetical protein